MTTTTERRGARHEETADGTLWVEVDVPAAYAGGDYGEDLAYLAALLLPMLATGTSRDTLARRIKRDWPPQNTDSA